MSVTIIDHTGDVLGELERAIEVGLEGIGIQCEGDAALELENSPRRVDTGRLRGSIHYEVRSGEKAVVIGTNVEYAGYVHFGTRKMAPNRFLTNAAEKNIDTYSAIMKAALESGGE